MVDCIFLRARIRADWQQFVNSTNSSDIPVGESVTGSEFHRIALVVALAISNPRQLQHKYFVGCLLITCIADKTEWDITRFADRVKNTRPCTDADNSAEDARLAKFFENPNFGDMDEPCTILDRCGRIMLWYLPHIFAPYRVVCILIILV